MSEPETSHNYQDQQSHITKKPYDIVLGWAVVCSLALGAVVGLLHQSPLRLGDDPAVQEGVMPAPRGTSFSQADGATPADEIGTSQTIAERRDDDAPRMRPRLDAADRFRYLRGPGRLYRL